MLMPAGDALKRMAFSKIRDQALARQFTDEGCTVEIAVFLFAPFLARVLGASKGGAEMPSPAALHRS